MLCITALAELNKYTLQYEYTHTFTPKIKAGLSLERPENAECRDDSQRKDDSDECYRKLKYCNKNVIAHISN